MPQLTIDVEEWRKRRHEAEKAAKQASKELVVGVDMESRGRLGGIVVGGTVWI